VLDRQGQDACCCLGGRAVNDLYASGRDGGIGSSATKDRGKGLVQPLATLHRQGQPQGPVSCCASQAVAARAGFVVLGYIAAGACCGGRAACVVQGARQRLDLVSSPPYHGRHKCHGCGCSAQGTTSSQRRVRFFSSMRGGLAAYLNMTLYQCVFVLLGCKNRSQLLGTMDLALPACKLAVTVLEHRLRGTDACLGQGCSRRSGTGCPD
jgi:hypothetical protein